MGLSGILAPMPRRRLGDTSQPRKDRTYKVRKSVVLMADSVAAANDEWLAEYVTRILEPIVRKDISDFCREFHATGHPPRVRPQEEGVEFMDVKIDESVGHMAKIAAAYGWPTIAAYLSDRLEKPVTRDYKNREIPK